MEEKEQTMIRVSRETRLKLYNLKGPAQTYDELINKLIEGMKD